jgi:poly(3-hydroxybutyrate) depolymerase
MRNLTLFPAGHDRLASKQRFSDSGLIALFVELMGIVKRVWKTAVLLALVGVFVLTGYELIAVRGTFARSRPASTADGTAVLVGAPNHGVTGRLYLSGTPSPTAPLVVVLHGDAPYIKPSYQYVFASELADALPGTRVVALLRPGYADPYGGKSDGDRGFALGENYTRRVIDDLAAATELLKSEWGIPRTILVGHSGGAALAADIAALNPGLVEHVFLVSCPCDVPAFRRHMARLQWSPLWLFPTRSVSPMQTLDQMQKSTAVTAISGSSDPVALPRYAESYVAKAKQLGISASMVVLPGQGHEILNDPRVISQIATIVRTGR